MLQAASMDSTKPLIFFLFSLLLLKYSFGQLCPDSSCRIGEPTIRFPFQLQNLQPKSCGYPGGFNLTCDALNQTLIGLPNSGQFTVQGIDYLSQHIYLNDPGGCLPRRLLTLNLSGSPFSGYFYENYVFFNCSFDYTMYKLSPVRCLSGRNYSVFASSSVSGISFLESRCSRFTTVAVPVMWTLDEPVETSELVEDILLRWDRPWCGGCEARGGQCGLKSSSGTDTECSHVTRRGLPKAARYAMIVGAGVPALLFLVGLLCCLCGKVKKRFTRRHLPIIDADIVVPRTIVVTTGGLDSSTIDSYPKTILGESRRLPKPEDITCSICLSEYKPQETLRSMPECQHCFHADCVDQWLVLKASCPVCRNSPN